MELIYNENKDIRLLIINILTAMAKLPELSWLLNMYVHVHAY
jgi:hypothetical protein